MRTTSLKAIGEHDHEAGGIGEDELIATLERTLIDELLSSRNNDANLLATTSTAVAANNNSTSDLVEQDYFIEGPSTYANTSGAAEQSVSMFAEPQEDLSVATSIIYIPEEELAPHLKFVWEDSDFHNAFVHHVADVCELSGTSEQLNIILKENEAFETEFTETALRMIDNFLSAIGIASVDVDTELKKFLSEQENWLYTLRNSNNLVIFDLQETCLKVQGMKDDVAEYEAILNEQFEETTVTKTNLDLCRQITVCDWLEEINHNLGNRATLLCTLADGTYSLFGRRCFVDQALEMIENLDLDSINAAPELNNEKLKVLEKLLLHENRNVCEDFIQSKFDEENVRCVLSIDSRESAIVLTANTEEMHKKGSKCLEEIMQSMEISLPKSAPKEVFEMDSWKSTVHQIQLNFPVVVETLDDCVRLDGFLDSVLPEITLELDQFMMSLENIKKISCSDEIKRLAKESIIPDYMEVADVTGGLLVTDVFGDVNSLAEAIQDMALSLSELTFVAPGLLTYFESNDWKKFVNLLETGAGCSIFCNMSGDNTSNNQDKTFEYSNDVGSVLNESISVSLNWPDLMQHEEKVLQLAESRAKHYFSEDRVIVQIYPNEYNNSVQKTKEDISHHMADVIETKTIEDGIISKLVFNDRFDIYQAAMQRKAAILFNDRIPEIVLKGLSKNVRNLSDEIQRLLFEVKEAELRIKHLIWKWGKLSQNCCNSFPPRVSLAIEKKYENNKNSIHSLSIFNSKMDVDFSSMTFTYNATIYQLQRIAAASDDIDQLKRAIEASEIPSNWHDMMNQACIRVPLDPASPEYNEALSRFIASDPCHSHVDKIERIQNPTLYQQYEIRKREVEKHLTISKTAEKLLFHGTSNADAEKICAEGFDKGFVGKNATRYGKGNYFALHSRYSDGYAPENSVGQKCMLLARVLTGDFCNGDPSLRAPPSKPCAPGTSSRKYDSVVDDADDPTIFVVFKDSSSYPNYLITYTS